MVRVNWGFSCALFLMAVSFSANSNADYWENLDKTEKSVVPNSIVKLISTLPNLEGKMEGSGFLIRYQDHSYVLTSEHVVFHDLENARHEVINPSFGSRMGKVKALDWGRGLALLEVPDLAAKDLFFEFIDEEPLAHRGGVRASRKWIDFHNDSIAGYPYGAKKLRSITPQIPINLVYGEAFPSIVHPLAKVLHVNLSAEFGMSGGVYLHDQIYLLGVLSYLQSLLPGMSPDVFAIDHETIAEFLRRTFKGLKPECEQNLKDQISGKIPSCGKFLIEQAKTPDPWVLLDHKWKALFNSRYYAFQWANSFSLTIISNYKFRHEVEHFGEFLEWDLSVYQKDPQRAKEEAEKCSQFLIYLKGIAAGDLSLRSYYDSVQSIRSFLQEIAQVGLPDPSSNY